MGLSAMDITIIILTILMSFKGIVNGFLKELFGFVGLIGGVFLASRFSEDMARYVETSMEQHIGSPAFVKLIGFVLILAIIWGISVFVSNIIISITSANHSFLDRLFGSIAAGVKYFFIFSMIASVLFRSNLIKDNMAKTVHDSKLYPVLDKLGSALINLTPLEEKPETAKKATIFVQDNNKTTQQ